MTTDPERAAVASDMDSVEGEDSNNEVGFKVNLSGRPVRASAILRSADGAIDTLQHLSAQGMELEVLQYFFSCPINIWQTVTFSIYIHHMYNFLNVHYAMILQIFFSNHMLLLMLVHFYFTFHLASKLQQNDDKSTFYFSYFFLFCLMFSFLPFLVFPFNCECWPFCWFKSNQVIIFSLTCSEYWESLLVILVLINKQLLLSNWKARHQNMLF